MRGVGWEYEALFDAESRTELEAWTDGGRWDKQPSSIRVGRMGYRTRTTKAGCRLEVDIYPIFGRDMIIEANRAMRAKTREAMQRINDRNAKRRLVQLVDANFTSEDIHLTLTYAVAPSFEQCQRDVRNFVSAVKRRRIRRGLPPLKYVYAIEDTDGDTKKRIHVHMIMSGGMDRAELEALWSRGYANADRLQPTDRGLEAIARYIIKSQKHRRRWSSSKNLTQPQVRVSDTKLSNARVKRIARQLPNEAADILRRVYPGYDFVECRVSYSDVVDGVYIRALMHRTGGGDKRGRSTKAHCKDDQLVSQKSKLYNQRGGCGRGSAQAQGRGAAAAESSGHERQRTA